MPSWRCFRSMLPVLWMVCVGQGALAEKYATSDGSRLWIEGRSNVNRFDCDARNYDLTAIVHRWPEAEDEPVTWEHVTVSASIPVGRFDCGNERMERDLEKTLKAAQFPEIRFDFIAAKAAVQSTDPGQLRTLRVWGDLSVAGERHGVDLVVEGHRDSTGRVHIKGETLIRMSDFGVDPPRRFLGLVRVQDELAVRFDLLLQQIEDNTVLDTPVHPVRQ